MHLLATLTTLAVLGPRILVKAGINANGVITSDTLQYVYGNCPQNEDACPKSTRWDVSDCEVAWSRSDYLKEGECAVAIAYTKMDAAYYHGVMGDWATATQDEASDWTRYCGMTPVCTDGSDLPVPPGPSIMLHQHIYSPHESAVYVV